MKLEQMVAIWAGLLAVLLLVLGLSTTIIGDPSTIAGTLALLFGFIFLLSIALYFLLRG